MTATTTATEAASLTAAFDRANEALGRVTMAYDRAVASNDEDEAERFYDAQSEAFLARDDAWTALNAV